MFTKEDNKICNKNIHINSPKHTKDKKSLWIFPKAFKIAKYDKYKFIELKANSKAVSKRFLSLLPGGEGVTQ